MKARTYSEIALYLEEHPCSHCGTRPELARLAQHDRQTATGSHIVLEGTCRKCRNDLRYEFDIPAEFPKFAILTYGGDEKSELFSAAEWRALAAKRLGSVSRQPAALSPKEFSAEYTKLNQARALTEEARKAGTEDPGVRASVEALLAQYRALAPTMTAAHNAQAEAEPAKAKLDKRSFVAHKEWLDRGKQGLGQLVVEGANVGGLPFGSINAAWSKLTRVDLSGSRVDFADFADATLNDVTAVKTNFGHSDFQRAHLTGCDLQHASLFLTSFQDAVLVDCDMRIASLDRGAWQRVTMRNCDLRKARIGDCRLDGAVVEDCDLGGANFGRIDLGLDLATTTGAVFRRCDFRGTHFDGRRLNNTSFIDCRFEGMHGAPEILGSYRIEGGDMSAAQIARTWGPSK